MRRVRRVPRQTSYESPMQTAVAGYLDGLEKLYPMELAWNHPPNEGSRDVVYAQKLKRQGVKAGYMDLNIYLAGGYPVFAELKAMDGSFNKDQWDTMIRLDALGFDCWGIAAITPSAAVDAVGTLLHLATNTVGHPGLSRVVRPGKPALVPFEGRRYPSFAMWPAREILRLGKKSIKSIMDATGKISP